MTEIADRIEDLTAGWFTEALREGGTLPADATVTEAECRFIGTGQLGSVVLAELRYSDGAGGPGTLVVKLPSTDAGSRQLGAAVGVYAAEVLFYRHISPLIAASLPHTHWGEVEPEAGRFTLVLDDLSSQAQVGDMIAGATLAQTHLAIDELVKLQTSQWDTPELHKHPWLGDVARTQMLFAGVEAAVEPFVQRFGERVEPEHVDLLRQVAPHANRLTELIWRPPFVVCHGDYRLDNMLFGTAAGAPALTVIDWQTVRLGPPLLDAAVFLASCVDTQLRRENEQDLLTRYHAGITHARISDFTLADCQASYRNCSLYPFALAVAMSVMLEQTERGDAMWTRLVRGAADLVLDTNATAILD